MNTFAKGKNLPFLGINQLKTPQTSRFRGIRRRHSRPKEPPGSNRCFYSFALTPPPPKLPGFLGLDPVFSILKHHHKREGFAGRKRKELLPG